MNTNMNAGVKEMSLTYENNKQVSTHWKEKSLDILQNFSSRKKTTSTEMASSLFKTKESLENKLNLQMDEIKRIEEEIQDVESRGDIDFIKYKLDLYQLITNITWDLNSLPTDIRGYVSKPFNAFNMSTNTHSKFHIINYLWKLISGEVEPFSCSL